MLKKVMQNLFCGLISLILSFLLYRFITIKVLDILPIIFRNRILAFIGVVLVQSVPIYIILRALLNNKLDKTSKKILWVQYFLVLIFLLFGRTIGAKGIELNLLNSVKDWFYNSISIVISIANLLMFLPIGFFFKEKKLSKAIFIMLAIIISCEGIQYLFSLGFFDIGDIILNLLGFVIGVCLFKSRFMIKNKHLFEI